MEFWNRCLCVVFAICFGLALNGCAPGQNDSDETKEPHFVLGQSRVNAMDYQGAIEAFQESLEVSPHSAQAHYQLAMLYEQHAADPAAAIYHYEQYLNFDPKTPNADVITQRIESCKQQLAADVMAMPTAPAAMKQIEQLTETNQMLQEQLKQWQAYANQLAAAAKVNPPAVQNDIQQQPIANPIPAKSTQTVSETSRPRTHIVVAGETEAAIARKSGVKLSALQAANPGVNPAKLRVGQILNLPPP